jgi:hypothetical protein
MDPASFATSLIAILKTYWIVPVGIIALYYYGRFHFNTPDYSFDLKDRDGIPLADGGRLLTLAPPIFTTSRARFNRYARRYVLILEAAFLIIVFFSGIVADIVQVGHVQLNIPTENDTIQYRAIWALFFLTGLLSSFPLFKDIDSWILAKLHQAALIPDDVRFFAEMLCDAPFKPSPAAVEAVREVLRRRDTIRVAEGKAEGTLEMTLLKALWLKAQLQQVTVTEKYRRFRQKLQRDVQDIAAITTGMRTELKAYFIDQEKVVPGDTSDIDNYISDNLHLEEVQELAERRRALQAKCDALYNRLCLISALSVYATEFTPEDVSDNLRTLGFQINVTATPTWDWDAVAKTLGGVFVVLLALNLVFAALIPALGIDHNSVLSPTRDRLIFFTVFGTLLYAAVLLAAIRLKRYWRREEAPGRRRPENLIIASYGYIGAVLIFVTLQFGIRGYLTWGPALFALNQGLVGYFAGLYIDRSMTNEPKSCQLPLWQAAGQFTVTLLAGLLAPPPPGVELSVLQSVCLAMFFACQSAAAGAAMGWLFQYFYRRCEFEPRGKGEPASSIKVLGDLTLQLRPAAA